MEDNEFRPPEPLAAAFSIVRLGRNHFSVFCFCDSVQESSLMSNRHTSSNPSLLPNVICSSIGTTVLSAVTSWSIDSPIFGASTPTWSSVAAPLSSNTPCVAVVAILQPPINSDRSSVFNDSWRVVPARFRLTSDGTATCQLPPATISLPRTAGASPDSINESSYIIPAYRDFNSHIDRANGQSNRTAIYRTKRR